MLTRAQIGLLKGSWKKECFLGHYLSDMIEHAVSSMNATSYETSGGCFER
jgi:hypothetical protein